MTQVCLLEKNIPIYVPYAKATMAIESDIFTKEVNEIAMFILSELNRGAALDVLKQLIHVPSETFEEITRYLIEHNLLNEEMDLTDRGEMYAELHREIERFNEEGNESFVNLYTGELELYLIPETASLPKSALQAHMKIQTAARKLYEENIDAAPNTEDIIEELIEEGKLNPLFEDDITETLHLQLKLQRGEVWVQRYISSLPMTTSNETLALYEVEEDGALFHLNLPVKIQVVKPMHELEMQYMKELPFLQKLSEELLSEKALKVLKHAQRGEKMGKKKLYHYAYLEQSFEKAIIQEQSKDYKKIALPPQFDWIEEDELKTRFFNGLGSKWKIIKEQEYEEALHIQGPFHAFFYTENDFEQEDTYKTNTSITRETNLNSRTIVENGIERKMTAEEYDKFSNIGIANVTTSIPTSISKFWGI